MKNINEITKSRVINKDAIESKLANYYRTLAFSNGVSEEKACNSVIRVQKLKVYVSGYGIMVGGAYADDDFLDEDYAFDYEMSMCVGNELLARFSIPPTVVYVAHGENGLILEWHPNKPLSVKSFDEYLKLYQSFADYIESDSERRNVWNTENLDDTDYKICCSVLYENMDIEHKPKVSPKKRDLPLFTFENFYPSCMTIITHEGIFQSRTDSLFMLR